MKNSQKSANIQSSTTSERGSLASERCSTITMKNPIFIFTEYGFFPHKNIHSVFTKYFRESGYSIIIRYNDDTEFMLVNFLKLETVKNVINDINIKLIPIISHTNTYLFTVYGCFPYKNINSVSIIASEKCFNIYIKYIDKSSIILVNGIQKIEDLRDVVQHINSDIALLSSKKIYSQNDVSEVDTPALDLENVEYKEKFLTSVVNDYLRKEMIDLPDLTKNLLINTVSNICAKVDTVKIETEAYYIVDILNSKYTDINQHIIKIMKLLNYNVRHSQKWGYLLVSLIKN